MANTNELEEINRRIAMDNLRNLVEQGAYSGAADDARISERIAGY